MLSVLTQLKKSIAPLVTLLTTRPDIVAISLPGAIGGGVVYWLAGAQIQSGFPGQPSLFLSIVVGFFSGIVLIGLITNTDRRDGLRLVALAFLGGLAWPVVISQGLALLFGPNQGLEGTYALAGEVVGAAAVLEKRGSSTRTEQLERVASDLAESLPPDSPLRDDVLDTISDRLTSLEQYPAPCGGRRAGASTHA